VEFDAWTLFFMLGVSSVVAATLALFAMLRVRMTTPAAFLREEGARDRTG
jgi:hypothetical protein